MNRIAKLWSKHVTKAGAIALATALTTGAIVVAAQAPASADGAGQPFSCATATDFVVSDTSTNAITYEGAEPASPTATASFAMLGGAGAPIVNALGFNPIDHYLYSLTVANLHLVRTDSAGSQTDLGAIAGLPTADYNRASFDPSGYMWVSSGTSAYQIDVNARTVTRHTMSSALFDGAADWTYAYGSFWGTPSDTHIYRYNPATGVVSSYVVNFTEATTDSAFTYANGDIALVSSYAKTLERVTINNPTSATPTFTRVSTGTAPAAGTSGADAASCVQTPAVTTTSLPSTAAGRPYSTQLAASGGDIPANYTWAITSGSLPDGLTLDPSTGIISGSTTGSGTSTFTVQVTANGSLPTTATQSLSIAVAAAVAVTTTSLPNGTYGQSYSATLAASGGSGSYVYSVTAGTLPAGLTLDSATGAITGTPAAAGTSNFTVQASDSTDTTQSASQALSININPAVLTATVTAAQTYGGAPTFSVSGYAGLANGDNGSVVTGALTNCSTTVDLSASAGTYNGTIGGCSGLSNPNYTITYVDGGVTVNPAVVTATVTGAEVYGSDVPTFAVSGYSGFVNGESSSTLSGSLTGCTTSNSAGASVGNYSGTISGCSGLTSPNYTLAYVDGGLRVTPAPLTVTVTGAEIYGGSPTFSISGYSEFANADNASSVTGSLSGCGTTVGSTATSGSYANTISGCSGLSASNYAVSYSDGGFMVNPATVTATVIGTKPYGTNTPTFSVSGYSGFVNGEDSSSLSGSLSGCTTSVPANASANSYANTISGCSGLSSSKYTMVYKDGGFGVTPADLSITASSASKTYGAAAPAIAAAFSGLVNGDTSASLTTAPACSSAANATASVGNYTSSCSGAVDTNYNITYATGTVKVVPAALTVTASSANSTYGSASPTIAPAYSGFVNDETAASLSKAPTCSSSVTSTTAAGTYASTCSGAVDANYSIIYVTGSVVVSSAGTAAVYTGPQQVAPNSTFVPTASLVSAASACQTNQPIAFTLDKNPLTGAAGPYTLETATTNTSGLATGASIKTTSWQTGAYNVTATYAGNANCGASSGSGALAVNATSGQLAFGSGGYIVTSAGHVSVAFVVGLVPKTTNKYVGGISLVNDGKWWLTGSFSGYTKGSSAQGSGTGTGNLYSWNQSLNKNHGGWVLVKSSVAFKAAFNANTKTAPASFGIQITYTPAAGQAALPNSAPMSMRPGVVVVF